MRQIPYSYFNRPAPEVAQDLLGCFLVRKVGDRIIRSIITETEAYEGFTDKASHASRGKTMRNSIMFQPAGHIYVYFTYGMHWMLNLVTGPKDHPAAVLIRGTTDVSGPGRLTKYFNITGSQNGKMLGRESGLWVEEKREPVQARSIKATGRIGVDYAGPRWSKRKWRFVLIPPRLKQGNNKRERPS